MTVVLRYAEREVGVCSPPVPPQLPPPSRVAVPPVPASSYGSPSRPCTVARGQLALGCGTGRPELFGPHPHPRDVVRLAIALESPRNRLVPMRDHKVRRSGRPWAEREDIKRVVLAIPRLPEGVLASRLLHPIVWFVFA